VTFDRYCRRLIGPSIGARSPMASTVLQACHFLTATTLSMPVQRSKEVLSLLSATDQQAMASLNVYQSLDYANSAYYAKDAYSRVLEAAQQIKVPVEQQASPADYKAHGSNYMFSDDFNPGRRH